MSETQQPGSKPNSPGGGATALLQAHQDAISSGSGDGRTGKKRGPYRKRGDTIRGEMSQPGAGMGGGAPSIAPGPLFNEENTGRLVALPFTLAAIATNFDQWRLEPEEQKELAATGAVALNEWVRVDPKWVALCLFSLSLSGVAVGKAIEFQAEQKRRKYLAEIERQRRMGARPPAVAPAPEPKGESVEGNIPWPEGGFIRDAAPKPG